MDHVISSDGTPIAVWQSGSGPPLLLVHGATADHSRWYLVQPAFEHDFTVYTVDRRGRGQSGDAETYSFEQEARDVAAVVDWIGEPVNVLGHSFGATCCLEAATLTTNMRKLVLYEPAMPGRYLSEPIMPAETIEKMEALFEQGDHEGCVVTLLRDGAGVTEEQLAVMRAQPYWPDRVAIAHTVVREVQMEMSYDPDLDRLRTINTPTLQLVGADSPTVAQEIANLLDDLMPNSRVHSMPGQGHVAMISAPDVFVEAVKTFLME